MLPKQALTAEQTQQLVAEYEASASMHELAARWGPTGQRWLHSYARAGVRPRRLATAAMPRRRRSTASLHWSERIIGHLTENLVS